MSQTNLEYHELSSCKVSQDVLTRFKCSNPDFNDFLHDDSDDARCSGKGVTYILVSEKEYQEKNITMIFAFATLVSSALHYNGEGKDTNVYSIPSVEIKYFAIAKMFEDQMADSIDPNKHYATVFFEILLTNIYLMSMDIIGFNAIFLRANEAGYHLYKRKKFVDASKYVIPYEEDDANGICAPMCMMIQDDDNLCSIFGEE